MHDTHTENTKRRAHRAHDGRAQLQAIVAGGGIAGLALAGVLGRLGWDVEVIERAAAFRAAGAGIVLSPASFAICEALGFGEEIAARSRETGAFQIAREDGAVVSGGGVSGGVSRTIHRAALHEVLHTFAVEGGARLTMGQEVRAIEVGADAVSVTRTDGATRAVDMLIGADGLHASTRALLHPEETPRYAGYTCWRFVAPNVASRDTPVELWGDHRRLGVVPLQGDACYVYACADAPAGARDPADRDEAWAGVMERFAGFLKTTGEARALIEAARDADTPLLRHDLGDLANNAWGQGRALLIGDAAHATTPNMGYGAGLALEDVIALATHLRDVTDTAQLPDALDAVRAVRDPRTRDAIDTAWQIGRTAHGNTATRTAALAAMRLAPDFLMDAQVRRFLAPAYALIEQYHGAR